LKILDKLVSKSFIGPSLMSFFIALFVLVMQFLWKYIDEILGRGFTILEISEIIFYFTVTLIPMALPITILISSVMVFGDMAEKYELSSFKSAGVSLLRVILPGFSIAILIAMFSFLSSNILKPAANFQFQKKFMALRNQKAALAFEEGIFNDDFNEVVIRINKIEKDGESINDILMYDHTSNDKSQINVMMAKKGKMFTAQEGKYFVMSLDTGIQYSEIESSTSLQNNKKSQPFSRLYFDHWIKSFDMSEFQFDEGMFNINRNREDLLNSLQLIRSIDTFNTIIYDQKVKINSNLDKLIFINSGNEISEKNIENQKNNIDSTAIKIKEKSTRAMDSIEQNDSLAGAAQVTLLKQRIIDPEVLTRAKLIQTNAKQNFIDTTQITSSKKVLKQKNIDSLNHLTSISQTIDSLSLRDVLTKTISSISIQRDELSGLNNIINDYNRTKQKYLLNLNQHFSWAMICIIFLFIGAPLGSIIKKGGYGYPLLVAILFYMIFIISTIYGTKMVKNEFMGGILAAWLPCLVLLPFSITFTYFSLKDIQFNKITVPSFILKFFKKA